MPQRSIDTLASKYTLPAYMLGLSLPVPHDKIYNQLLKIIL